MYSKSVMKHFMKPKNQGQLKNPDGVGTVGNPTCGDIMTVYIKVKEKKGAKIISEVKFETLGCAAAIATSSMVTELARNKNLDEALLITRQDVADNLDGLPPAKMHCSNLATDALRRAIEDYRSKTQKETPKPVKMKKKKK